MLSCVEFTAHCADLCGASFYPYFEWCAIWSHPLHHTMYLFIQNNVTLTVFCCHGDGWELYPCFYGRMVLYRAGFLPLFIQMYIFMQANYTAWSTSLSVTNIIYNLQVWGQKCIFLQRCIKLNRMTVKTFNVLKTNYLQ